MQISVAVVLFSLILEMMELGEAYKIVRPYKYYNPPPWRSLRWHPLPKYRNLSKRMPALKYNAFRPDGNRYAPYHEESVDIAEDEKPYIIFIQLPQRKEKRKKRTYRRLHVAETSQNERDAGYIDDDLDGSNDDIEDDPDDDELKVYTLDDKMIRIKVN